MEHHGRGPRALRRARMFTAGAVLTAVVATGAISTELALTHTASAVSSPSDSTTSSTTSSDTGSTGSTGSTESQATTPPASGSGAAQHGTTSAS